MSPTVSTRDGTTFAAHRCGDTGLLIEAGENDVVQALTAALTAAGPPGVTDVVPAMHTVLVTIDPSETTLNALVEAIRTISPSGAAERSAREVSIPVVYDGEDLDFVAEHTGLGTTGVIEAHQGSRWRVGFCGFAPGFAYLVGGDPRLEVPRRAESRVRVPAGAVALAGTFASVYPRESPGGWQLIGHTDLSLWDTAADPPALLTPGTAVRFHEASP